jgi:hypothetical protein
MPYEMTYDLLMVRCLSVRMYIWGGERINEFWPVIFN